MSVIANRMTATALPYPILKFLIAADMVSYVMQRGRRADSAIPGHGIGLSIVADIAQVYGGNLEIGISELGGAAVNVWLPMRVVTRVENNMASDPAI